MYRKKNLNTIARNPITKYNKKAKITDIKFSKTHCRLDTDWLFMYNGRD